MDKIKVGVRIRPLIENEMDQRLAIQWGFQEKTIYQIDPRTGKKVGNTFAFDYIFNEKHTNENLFTDLAKPILDSVIQGYNGTIFAYGQTSSGKTHTMNGNTYDEGIIPRSIKYLFNQLNSKKDRMYLVRASYLEIYNEIIIDLLTKRKCSKIGENLGNVVVVDLKEEVVDSPQKVLELLALGNKNRQTAETAMNEKSSRSHAIFRIIIESRGGNDDFILSQLNLVDLAGSEKANLNSGIRSREGCAINKSLFMLSKVISQLSEQQEVKQFISFRDSKLTRILQNSLGGNSLTAIICAITPSTIEESISTLGFALRAKKINVNPSINEIISDQALLKKFQQEIDSLQLKLNEKDQLIERLNSLKTKVLGASSSKFLIKEDISSNRRMTWHRIDSSAISHNLSFNSLLEIDELPALSENKYSSSKERLNFDPKTTKSNKKSILKSNSINIKSNTSKLPQRNSEMKNKKDPKSEEENKICQIETENNDLKMELELLRRKFRIREEELVSRLENYENIQFKSKNNKNFIKSENNKSETQKSVSSYNDRISILELEKMKNEKTIENLKVHLDNLEKKNEELINGHRFEEEMREKYIQEIQEDYSVRCQEYEKKIEMLKNLKLKDEGNQDKVETCEKNTNQLLERIETLEMENAELKRNKQADYSAKCQEYEKKIEMLNKLKLKNKDNQDKVETYEKNAIQFMERIETLEMENVKLKCSKEENNLKLQKELNEKMKLIQNLKDKLKELELNNNEREFLNNELIKLNSKLKCINDEKTALQTHFQSAIEEKCNLQTIIENYKEKLDKGDEENRKMIADYDMKLNLLRIEKENFVKQLNLNLNEMNNDDSQLLNEIQDFKLQIELLQNEKAELNNQYQWAVESKQEKQTLIDEKIDEIDQLNLEFKNYRKEFNELKDKYESLLQRHQKDASINNENSNCPADYRCNYKLQLDSINRQLREEINSLGVEVASKNLYHSDSLKLLQTLLKCVVEKNQEIYTCINEKFVKEKNELRENIKRHQFELNKELKLRQQVENLVENYDSGLKSSNEEREDLISKLAEYKKKTETRQEEESDKLTIVQTQCQQMENALENLQQQYSKLEIDYQNQKKIIQDLKKNEKQPIYHFKATQTTFIENSSPHRLARSRPGNYTDAATSTEELTEITCQRPSLESPPKQLEKSVNITHHSISSDKLNFSSEHEDLLIEKNNLETNYSLLKNDYRKLIEKYNQLQNREEIKQLETQLNNNGMNELDLEERLEQNQILARLSWIENCRILEVYSKEIDTLNEELNSTKNHLTKVLSELESQPKGAAQQVESLKLKLVRKETDYALLREVYRKLIRYFNQYKRENPPLQEIKNVDFDCERELSRDSGEEEEEEDEDVKEMKQVDRLNRKISTLNVNTVFQWNQHLYMIEELYIEKENLEQQLVMKEKELEKCRGSYLETKRELLKNENHQGNSKNESATISSLKLEIASFENKLKAEKQINEMLLKELEMKNYNSVERTPSQENISSIRCDQCDKYKDQIFQMNLKRREIERNCEQMKEKSCTLRQQVDQLESNLKQVENRTTHNECEIKISNLEDRNKLLVNVCKIRQDKICELQDLLNSYE